MLHRSTEQWAANRSKGSSTAQPMRTQLPVSRSQSERALYCNIMSRDRQTSCNARKLLLHSKDFLRLLQNDCWFASVIKINLQDLIWLKFNHETADDMPYLVVKFQTDWPKNFFSVNLQSPQIELLFQYRAARGARRTLRVRASIQK